MHSADEDVETGNITSVNADARAAGVTGRSTVHSPRVVLYRILRTVLMALSLSALLVISLSLVWYFLGFMFLVQIVIVAVVVYLTAGGGYKWLYLLLRTGPRDLT